MHPTRRPADETTAAPGGWRPMASAAAGQGLRLLAVLAVLYAVYGGVHMAFFRAESGGLLADVQHGWPAIRHRLRDYLTTSHNGHYTPLFFSFELLCAVLCTTSEACWRLRQLTLLALLTLALLALFRRTTPGDAGRTARWSMAAGLSALFVLSPVVVGLVGWPFMSAQLLWATCTALSLVWLGEAAAQVADGEVSARTLGASLGFAYLSLHAFGLGLTTLAGWFAGWAALFLAGWRGGRLPRARLRLLGGVGVGGMLLTAAHLALMVVLLPKDTPIGAAGSVNGPSRHPFSWPFAAEALGYTGSLLFSCVRTLWSPNAWSIPDVNLIAHDWPYGLGALGLLAAAGAGGWRAYRAEPTPGGLRALCWHVFSLAAIVVFAGLVVVRVHQDNGDWAIYLFVDRYIWPGAILLLGFAAALASWARVRDRVTALAIGGLLVGGTALGNVVYQRHVLPTIWPWTQVACGDAWQQTVAMTRELRQAHLPVPDLGMAKLTMEFGDRKLRLYSSLLRQRAGLPRTATLDWVESAQITPDLWRTLMDASPALARLTGPILSDPETSMLAEDVSLAVNAHRPSPLYPLTAPAVLATVVLAHASFSPHLGVDIVIGGDTKKTFWIEPPTTLTFPNLTLGKHPVFISGVAIHPSLYWDDRTDGATFRVQVRAGEQTVPMGELYINPNANPAERCWMPLRVDLARFAGQRVDLILTNGPGPADNAYGDWCLWGDPHLVDE